MKPSAILIAGPTASGKTALAVALSKALGGAVINADSMQVYADLPILSARPDVSEQDGVDHHLFGHVDGAVNYSAGKWRDDAARAIVRVREAGQVPVITGGTGLYFKSVLQGLSDIPAVPDAVRQRVRDSAEGCDAEALHAQLKAVDPKLAQRIKPADQQRIVRALEVFEASGQPLSSFQDNRGEPLLNAEDCIAVFLEPDRPVLRERINLRFDRMIANGALEEVRILMERGVDPQLPVMRALGVPGLLDHLRGELALDQAIEKGKGDTRRYAKRQFTWFRHQLPDFQWAAPDAAHDLILARVRTARSGN